jgi:hypothetical protein
MSAERLTPVLAVLITALFVISPLGYFGRLNEKTSNAWHRREGAHGQGFACGRPADHLDIYVR